MSPPQLDSPAEAALRSQAEQWLANDPDPATRAELRAVIDGLPATAADLADRFAGPLRFGTAGLRGPMRAGPNGMNLAVVQAATAGLVAWLSQRDAGRPVVIGYDARRHSHEFARQAARVVTGTGRRALLMPRALPTPVLAHAVQLVGACAGIMVTASHNPPQDNGYKVYLGAGLGGPGGDGAQLIPPADAQIEAAIPAIAALPQVPLGDFGEIASEDLIESYLDGAVAVIDPDRLSAAERESLSVAYTAMHGVGAQILRAAFGRAGFAPPATVREQIDPDPAFPTVSRPNPEEPGAMDRLIALARAIDADLAIANDPDADRCAVAIPGRPARPGEATPRWRMLHGDEVGVLLADHLMRRGVRGLYATTAVSSSLLAKLCAARGQPYGETLTGFKWIVRAASSPDGVPGAGLVYGYEEALGYCAAPGHVRDKDGITAALLVAELAAELKAACRSLEDRLDELAAEFGVHATGQISLELREPAEAGRIMARLRHAPPSQLLGEPVTSVQDRLPGADLLTLRSDSGRVVVRPSGTEPKLKVYFEIVEPVAGTPASEATAVAAARERAARRLAALRTEVGTALRP